MHYKFVPLKFTHNFILLCCAPLQPYQALLPLMKSESNERNPEAVATAAEQGLHLCMLAVWDNEFSIGTAMQPKCFRAASGVIQQSLFPVDYRAAVTPDSISAFL